MQKNVRACKRVLFVTAIVPPDIGGPATYCARMARAAHDAGHDVGVVAYGTSDPDATAYPFPVWRISRHFLPLRLAAFMFRLLVSGSGYDVWYAHGGLSATAPALLIARLLRKRFGAKITGDYAWEQARNRGLTSDDIGLFQERHYGIRIESLKALRGFVARRADFIIVPSAYLASLARHWGVRSARIFVIYNSVVSHIPLSPDLRMRLRERFGLRGPTLITVARLVPWKGIDGLISIMPALLARDPAITLIIVGDGPLRARLEAYARASGVFLRVRFAGSLSHDDTLRHLEASDMFLLNSSYEGFSHVLLEAMGAGCPVIARACGGNTELIVPGTNGYLVSADPTDGEWTETISRALDDSFARVAVVSEARRTFSRFSFARMVRETLAALS